MDLNTIGAFFVLVAGAIFKFYQESKRHKEVINLQKIQHDQVLKKAEEKDKIDNLQLEKLDSIKSDLVKALDSVIAKNRIDADVIKNGAFAEQGEEFVNDLFLLFHQNHLENKAKRMEDINNLLRNLLKRTDDKLRPIEGLCHYLISLDLFIEAVLTSDLPEQIYGILLNAKQREQKNTTLEHGRLMDQLDRELRRLYQFWVNRMKQQFPF